MNDHDFLIALHSELKIREYDRHLQSDKIKRLPKYREIVDDVLA